jgi:hypothetical protein
MVALTSLLELGYFPRELPPVFTTRAYAVALTTMTPPYQGARKSSHLMPFSLGRVGGLRRMLSIPNPLSFGNLALQMSSHWQAINAHLAANKLSFTSPIAGTTTGRALDPRFKLEALPIRRAITRAGGRYLVQADVARFYPSIYTHTIPWAAHGKSTAKQRRHDRSLYGNLLDEAVRQCQDDQTVGIPIGPDSSLVVAELILSKVDQQLRGIASERTAFRYIDDYEISCSSLRQAEETLAALNDALRDYELELNDRKSAILELPRLLYDTWKDPLARFEFVASTSAESREEVVRYFTIAFDLRAKNPDAYVLNYAISRLPLAATKPSSWRLLEALLLQCLTLEAGSTRYVIAALLEASSMERRLNRDQIAEVLSTHVEEHARLGHTAEVAWALWGANELRLELSEAAAVAISKMDDAVAALLALRAKKQGALPKGLQTRIWRAHMNADGLYGPSWLLAYEANVRGWLPNADGIDHVAADPFFGLLKQQQVSFLDLAPVSAVPRLRLGIRRAAQAVYD